MGWDRLRLTQIWSVRKKWTTLHHIQLHGGVASITPQMQPCDGSLENQSESTVRLSIDCRWQPAAEPIDPRYITDDEWNKARGIDIPPGTCAHESESLKANSLAAGRRAQKKTRDMFQAKKDWGLEH